MVDKKQKLLEAEDRIINLRNELIKKGLSEVEIKRAIEPIETYYLGIKEELEEKNYGVMSLADFKKRTIAIAKGEYIPSENEPKLFYASEQIAEKYHKLDIKVKDE